MLRRFLLVAILLGALLCSAEAQLMRKCSPGNIYALLEHRCIYQSTEGLIWMGTTNGLFSYDGWRYQQYLRQPQTGRDTVTAMCALFGELWVGYQDGTIGVLRGGKIQIMENLSPGFRITDMVADDNHLWVSTYGDGLWTIHEKQKRHITDELPSLDIYSMESGSGSLWIATDAGLAELDYQTGKRIQVLTRDNGLPDVLVTALNISPDGQTLQIGFYDQGVCEYSLAERKVTVFKPLPEITAGSITGLIAQDEERVWVATDRNYVLEYTRSDQRWSIFHDFEMAIHHIGLDHEGNLWVTTNEAQWLCNNAFQWHEQGLPVQAIWVDKDYKILATQEGIPGHSELNAFDITCFYRAGDLFLVGTFGQGLVLWNPQTKKVQRFTQKQGLAHDNVLSLTPGLNANEVYASTLDGVSRCRLQGSALTFEETLRPGDQTTGNYIYQTLAAKDGSLYFATEGAGLIIYKNGEHNHIDKLGDKPIKTVYSMAQDGGGNIWFAAPYQGLFRYDGKVCTLLGLNDGLEGLEYYGLKTDRNGDILAIYNNGVNLIEYKTQQVRTWNETDFKNLNPDINAIMTTDSSRSIWLATARGVLCYSPRSKQETHQSRTILRAVTASFRPLDPNLKSAHLSYSERSLVFEYAGLWFTSPDQVKHRHKLVGIDKDWRESRDLVASYPNLPPGKYTFIAQSTIHATFDDVSEVRFEFTIAQPFWQTIWFWGLILVALGSGLYFWIKARDKKLNREIRQREEQTAFKLNLLQSQVNPHFLFNSFNTLLGFIEDNPKEAAKYTEHLSDYYRHLLQYREVDMITLREEVELLNNYYALLRYRYGDNLMLDVELTEEDMSRKLLPLTLQMLLENAVKHNAVAAGKTMTVTLRYDQKDKCLNFGNNIYAKRNREPSTGFGLDSLRNRYRLKIGREVVVVAQDGLFTVKIPC